MKNISRKNTAEANAASMADIAFLLLIFFMVTTTIVNDKGLDLLLPPYRENNLPKEIHERNIFKILINSNDKLMVENKPRPSAHNLREDIKAFILNNGKNPELSEKPHKAVISIKTNRGTSHGVFIKVLDEAKAAYYEIYGSKLDIPTSEVRKLDRSDPRYVQLKKQMPMNISIAEPE